MLEHLNVCTELISIIVMYLSSHKIRWSTSSLLSQLTACYLKTICLQTHSPHATQRLHRPSSSVSSGEVLTVSSSHMPADYHLIFACACKLRILHHNRLYELAPKRPAGGVLPLFIKWPATLWIHSVIQVLTKGGFVLHRLILMLARWLRSNSELTPNFEILYWHGIHRVYL